MHEPVRDIDLLKIMTVRVNYENYLSFIDQKAICNETDVLLQDFGAYYERFRSDSIDFSSFSSFFHHLRHVDYSVEDRNLFDSLFIKLQQPLTETAEMLIERYKAQTLGKALSDATVKTPDSDTYVEILDKYLFKEKQSANKTQFITTNDIAKALAETDPEGGYSWRLRELDTVLGTISPGTFGVVAARPNSGKTSFLVSEMTFLVQQLKDDETILWLNNENKGIRIVPRLYSAMLGANRAVIQENAESAELKFANLGGNKIKLLDIHKQNTRYIEKLIRQIKPTVVVIDMLDHVKGIYVNKNDTSDAKYEALYQWALELSCVYNCLVIGTSQMSAPDLKKSYDTRYPPMDVLKGSKTAKQGACSWLLMIGRDDDNGFETARFLSAPKSKFGDDSFKYEVFFDREKSLFLSQGGKFEYFKE